MYVSGYALSLHFPVTGDALQGGYGGGADVFLAVLDPAAQGTFAGGCHHLEVLYTRR